ncbi:hypothetical protein K502DRAFT_329636, partial [Neoconidiobolus thromboides FSU 785]
MKLFTSTLLSIVLAAITLDSANSAPVGNADVVPPVVIANTGASSLLPAAAADVNPLKSSDATNGLAVAAPAANNASPVALVNAPATAEKPKADIPAASEKPKARRADLPEKPKA